MSSSDHMILITFTETIQNILKIHVAFNDNLLVYRQELSICPCNVKGHLIANFARSKYEMLMLHFDSIIQIHQYMIIIKLHVNGIEAMHRYINSVTTGQGPLTRRHLKP